jgi:hypothetical protein
VAIGLLRQHIHPIDRIHGITTHGGEAPKYRARPHQSGIRHPGGHPAAAHGNPEAMDAFVRVTAGVTSPAEFFSDDNVERIFAAAAQRQAS